MASQNPSSVPTVLPNALQPVANFTNNNTSVWALNDGGGVPILTPTTFRTTGSLPAGANSNVLALDTSDPAKFPPNTSYYFTMTGPFSSEGVYTCDTTIGQFSAMGLFSILLSGTVGFLSGSGVNTLPVAIFNPGDFYFQSVPGGIQLYTTSAAEFVGCTFIFTWTAVSTA